MQHSIELDPGTVIRTKVIVNGVAVWHEGLVTDRYGSDGSRTVISHCKKYMTTVHEEMQHFHGGNGFEVVGYLGSLAWWDVLARAWADVDARPQWSLAYNCQHATRKWHGISIDSPQVQAAIAGAIVVVAIAVVAVGVSRAA
jgi:hypothetical protein